MKTTLRFIPLAVFSLALGFWMTRGGWLTWDSVIHLEHGHWMMELYRGREIGISSWFVKWYGPLWELVMGVTSELIFDGLRDPIWVRHATTFALLPITLVLTYKLLREIGYPRRVCFLAVALFIGTIRMGGHAILNIKDFPLACAYLLTTLALWVMFQRWQGDRTTPASRIKQVAKLSAIALIPYFIRPPVMMHFGVIYLLVGLNALARKEIKTSERVWTFVVPPLVLSVMLWSLWPTLWVEGWPRGWVGWYRTFGLFSKFPWIGDVRIFGETYASTELPRWYALSWFVVALHPLAFFATIAGLLGFLKPKRPEQPAIGWDTPWRLLTISFPVWMAGFLLVPLLGIIVKRPILYDEERHVLFLFPPLLVLAAIGWGWAKKWMGTMSLAIIIASLITYSQWGAFSYIYKSPLIKDTRASSFMGDYWAVCLSPAVHALYGRIPPEATVWVPFLAHVAQAQNQRLTQSKHAELPGLSLMNIQFDAPAKGPYWAIFFNRVTMLNQVNQDVQSGKAKIIWQLNMPPHDEPACVIAEYKQ